MKIFDEKALRKLEQLTLVADKIRVGVMKGDRRSSKRGTSIEFADYRNYTRGDDLRRLDWNVYARLERPFIKLLEEEEDLTVHLLVDTSASMGWPEDADETHKLNYGLRLAGALGHIALTTGDRVNVTLLNAKGNQRWGPTRGKHNSLRLLEFLSQGEAEGITDLNVSLKNYALRGGRPGLLFLLSDLFSPAGYQEGLNAVQARGFEVGFIHLLSPDEVEPPVAGDVKLIDVETGMGAEISLDGRTVRAYRERFEAWQKELATYCGGRGVHYIPVVTDVPWERLLLQTLRARGIVR